MRFSWTRLGLCLALSSGTISSGAVAHARADDDAKSPAEQCLVYVGTYTGPMSQGIYAYRLDLKTGACTPLGLAAEAKSPSFLAIHPNRKFLYAVNEISGMGGKPTGGVSAFAIDAQSGKLKFLNHQPSQGAGPCHLVVDRTGSTVLVANYGGGSVASFPIGADGQLAPAASAIQHTGHSVNASRQKEPHAHSINVDLGNRFAMAADLGLDKVLVYRLDPATSKLTANDPPSASVQPGSGPRHFAFHPDGKRAYVINEILCTLTAFDYDGQAGKLTEQQTLSTLPQGVAVKPEYSTAEVQVHPSGKFVYGSNRGHDTIAVFAVGESQGPRALIGKNLEGATVIPSQGPLRLIGNTPTQGKTPRGFGIDPTGRFLLAGNQDSHTVVVFRIDAETGRLTPTGHTLEVGSPVCVKFVMP